MVEKAMGISTSYLSVLHFSTENWRSYKVQITSGIFKEECDTEHHPHRVKNLFDTLLAQKGTSSWWNLCFIIDGEDIRFDDYYLNLPINGNTDKTFKQLFEDITNHLTDFQIFQEDIIFITGNYTTALPLLYLLQKKYACHLIIQQNVSSPLTSPTLTLYSGIENQIHHFECSGYNNKKLIYIPYYPGEPCQQAYIWTEQDSMRNYYLCMKFNNQETKIIPWKN